MGATSTLTCIKYSGGSVSICCESAGQSKTLVLTEVEGEGCRYEGHEVNAEGE